MNSVCVCIIGMCLARSMASTQRPCRVQTASQSHESMETLLFLSLSFGVISPAYYHRPFISAAWHSVPDLFLVNFRYNFRTLALLFFIYKCYLIRLLDCVSCIRLMGPCDLPYGNIDADSRCWLWRNLFLLISSGCSHLSALWLFAQLFRDRSQGSSRIALIRLHRRC